MISESQPGDKITVRLDTVGGTQQIEVSTACKQNKGNWYCNTHREGFQNQFHMHSHTKDSRNHEIVWMCHEHGPETP